MSVSAQTGIRGSVKRISSALMGFGGALGTRANGLTVRMPSKRKRVAERPFKKAFAMGLLLLSEAMMVMMEGLRSLSGL